MADSLYEHDGDRIVPTVLALGPWRNDSLHGGAVAGLLARSLERDGFLLGRVTVDFLRRVPLRPLRLALGDERGTGRLRRQGVELWAGDDLVARAEGLRLPVGEVELPPAAVAPAVWGPPSGDLTRFVAMQDAVVERVGFPSFASHAIATEFVDGHFHKPGPVTVWLNLVVPLFPGEAVTGVQRAVIAADYASGGTGALPFSHWTFMNADLTVQLTREPEGDWIAVTSNVLAQPTGVGAGDGELHDLTGRFGRAGQTLLIERRPG